MKTIAALFLLVCAVTLALAQQPTPTASQTNPVRTGYRHRPPKRRVVPPPNSASQGKPEAAVDFLVGDAKVEVTKDETVVRLAMAQHGSILIELPANDGPRYIIPGDPEMATVDEKALERNKRAIVVRPGSLFVPPLPNRKARMPAATVTAQMRSGLVVTFLFYPVEDLAQNVHRCVLSYNRDEVVARRRAAGLPVNLDTAQSQERRIDTGQSTAPTSISVDTDDENKTDKSPESKIPVQLPDSPAATDKAQPQPITAATSDIAIAKKDVTKVEPYESIKPVTQNALAKAIKKPKQFKKWTKPVHGLSLAAVRFVEAKSDLQVLIVAVRNGNSDSVRLVPGSPDLLIEMLDDGGKSINLETIKKLHIEASTSGDIAAGATAYFALAYTAPVLSAHQQIRVVVSQTNAADEPASVALTNSSK